MELPKLLAFDGDKCDIESLLKRNSSDFRRIRIPMETSHLTDFCPNSFQLKRLEYLFGLLRIKQLDLELYNSTIDLQNALAQNHADFDAIPNFMDEKTIITPVRENITFVAPFAEDSVCLLQSVNVMLNRIVKFDDRFWIAPFNTVCWIIIASLLALQIVFTSRNRQENRFCKLALAHFDAGVNVIVALLTTLIYLPQLRDDTTTIQQYQIPYKTAFSFADAIMRGEARAALLNNSFVFNTLMEDNIQMYPSLGENYGFNYLAQALRRNPSNVIVFQSVDHACQEILNQDISTFLLLDDFRMKLCNATVVSQLQITCFDDAPTMQIAFLFSANSHYRENFSRLAEFIRIHELRHFLEDGKHYAPDIPTAYVRHGISITSLQLLFILYFSLLALGLLGCILEIFIAALPTILALETNRPAALRQKMWFL